MKILGWVNVLALLPMLAACGDGTKRTREVKMGDGTTITVEESIAGDGTIGAETVDEHGREKSFFTNLFAKEWPKSTPLHAPPYPGSEVSRVTEVTSDGVVQAQVVFTTPDQPKAVAGWYDARAYGNGIANVHTEERDPNRMIVTGGVDNKMIRVDIERKADVTLATLAYAAPAR